MNQRELVVQTAMNWLGVKEGSPEHAEIIRGYNSIIPLPRGYKVTMRDPWCAAFVSNIFRQCNLLSIFEPECSCGMMLVVNAKKFNTFIENDAYKPSLADIVLYDWDDNGKGDCKGYPDHVGIVVNKYSYGFKVIEGNKSNSVSTRLLSFNARYIRGFICPKYSETVDKYGGVKVPDVPIYTNLDEIARLVIRGDYGNGNERVSRLTAAGFDAKTVQAKVNGLYEKMKK